MRQCWGVTREFSCKITLKLKVRQCPWLKRNGLRRSRKKKILSGWLWKYSIFNLSFLWYLRSTLLLLFLYLYCKKTCFVIPLSENKNKKILVTFCGFFHSWFHSSYLFLLLHCLLVSSLPISTSSSSSCYAKSLWENRNMKIRRKYFFISCLIHKKKYLIWIGRERWRIL